MTQAPERIWATDIYCADGQIICYPDRYTNENVEYIRADLSRPRVKPLVWTNKNVAHGYPDEATDCMGGYWTRWWVDGKEYFRCPGEKYGREGSADKEHERRIMEALE